MILHLTGYNKKNKQEPPISSQLAKMGESLALLKELLHPSDKIDL